MRAIILAAGIGKRLEGFTKLPKSLITIKDEPLLVRMIRILKKSGISQITVVLGYRSGTIIRYLQRSGLRADIILNKEYRKGSILSLWSARKRFGGDVVIMDADLYFEEAVVGKMTKSKKKNFFLIDPAAARNAEAVIVGFNGRRAVALARGLKGRYEFAGEWAGFLKLSGRASVMLREILDRRVSSGDKETGYEFVMPELFDKTAIGYESVESLHWIEIDFPEDVRRAKKLDIA